MSNDVVTLKTNGQLWTGWTSVTIETGLETMTGSYSLGITDTATAEAIKQIFPGQSCSVEIDGTPIITGYIDDVDVSYSKDSHGLTVQGRDASADLVDCSAVHDTGRWTTQTTLQIVQDLCKPFGIKVTAEVEMGKPWSDFHLQTGETVYEALERVCRWEGVLATSDGLGGLLLTRAGVSGKNGGLRLGDNLLSGDGHHSFRDRQSEITVLGQLGGSDYVSPAQTAGPKAVGKDPNISRYRPLIVMAEIARDGDNFARRAAWEISNRAGRSRRATVAVQGWRDADGALWATNRMVSIDDGLLGIGEDFVLTNVKFTLDENGTRSELSLMPKEAFLLDPIPPMEANRA